MRLRLLPGLLVAAAVVAASVQGAAASSVLSVSVISPRPVPAGFESALTVRVEGEDPELATLSYEVRGGELVGAVSLNSAAPGVAEGTVYVRRDTPGDATLVVTSGGVTVASGAARFAAYGQLEVSATLAADAHASARTWRFEVLGATGAVVDTLSIGTSGAVPTGTAATAWLPYGAYTVRQVLGHDTATTCSAGAFYAIASPAGGSLTVDLATRGAVAAFAIQPCAAAPTSLDVSIPIDTVEPYAPIDEVLGARQEGPPLPPASGSGLAAGESATGRWLVLLALPALALSALLGAQPLTSFIRRR